MKDKLFITKKKQELYSKLWARVNHESAPSEGQEVKAEEPEKEHEHMSQEEAIECSCKIIGALRSKQKDHNSEFNAKMQFARIKEAYRAGVISRSKDSEKTCNQWGMANVNAFLMKSDEPDFERADKDIEKYGVDIKFNNLEDLYLEEYSPINKVY